MRYISVGGIILILVLWLGGCDSYENRENADYVKEDPTKLEDLFLKQEQEKIARIFIKEGNQMIPYLVVSKDYNGNTLLLREYLLNQPRIYNYAGYSVSDSSYYEGSQIDQFLNGKFYNSFSQLLKENIISSRLEITEKESLGIGGEDVTSINRKVFLLSYTEVTGKESRTLLEEGVPLACFSSQKSRIAYYQNGKAGSWWLRTADTSSRSHVAGVSDGGVVGTGGISGLDGEYLNGVRPAFCLDGNLEITPRENFDEGKMDYIIKWPVDK